MKIDRSGFLLFRIIDFEEKYVKQKKNNEFDNLIFTIFFIFSSVACLAAATCGHDNKCSIRKAHILDTEKMFMPFVEIC
jgi:hypothetical protein